MDKTLVQIELALMLIKMGKATIEEVREFFSSTEHDADVLAYILSECDRRLERRG